MVNDVCTRDKVVALREAHPNMRAIEMAKTLGVTRERVRQILFRAGLPTQTLRNPRPMPTCGKCGLKIARVNKSGLCIRCKVTAVPTQQFSCAYCGAPIYERLCPGHKNIILAKKVHFCDKRCQGKWVAENYGFKPGLGGRPRKYDCNQVAELLNKGVSLKEIASQIGIGLNSLYGIAIKLYKNGKAINRSQAKRDNRDLIIKYLKQGKSYAAICSLGIPINRVYRVKLYAKKKHLL